MAKIAHLVPLGFLAFTSVVAAPGSAIEVRHGVGKDCVELEVPVLVVATDNEYNIPRVDNNIEAADWSVNVTTWSLLVDPRARIVRPVPINATFKINAKLCVPNQRGPRSDILQIATQGNGFDKRYWDVEPSPEKYSYVEAAIRAGYSILTYDKLGTGRSDKPDGYTHVQIPSEVEILAGLTKLARAGKLASSPSRILSGRSTVGDFIPRKVVQVSHAYGSILVQSVLSKYGNLSDAAILTGFYPSSKQGIVNVGYSDHEYAAEHDRNKFGDYGPGYIVLTTRTTQQRLFFHGEEFEPRLLDHANWIKQPKTVGTFASQLTNQFIPAGNFTGPVKVSFSMAFISVST